MKCKLSTSVTINRQCNTSYVMFIERFSSIMFTNFKFLPGSHWVHSTHMANETRHKKSCVFSPGPFIVRHPTKGVSFQKMTATADELPEAEVSDRHRKIPCPSRWTPVPEQMHCLWTGESLWSAPMPRPQPGC